MSAPDVASSVLTVADAIGALMEGWGFKRNMGRIWALLYLQPRPLSAPDIGEALQLSAGAVSMLLAELTTWGAVRKTWLTGERREHFEAETDIWKLVSRVFRERELRWIEDALTAFTAAAERLQPTSQTSIAPSAQPSRMQPSGPQESRHGRVASSIASDAPHPGDDDHRALARERILGLAQLATVGAHLLKAMLDGESIDALPLKHVGELASLARATRS